MKRSTTIMNILKLRVKGKLLDWCRSYQRHPGLNCIPSPEERTEETRDNASLPARMGFSSLSTKVQATYVTQYDGKSSLNQHIYYFRSQTGNMIDNDAVMVRLFIGTLKGVAFDWFKSLPSGSINSWVDLETQFLSRFYKDDTRVTMDNLLLTV